MGGSFNMMAEVGDDEGPTYRGAFVMGASVVDDTFDAMDDEEPVYRSLGLSEASEVPLPSKAWLHLSAEARVGSAERLHRRAPLHGLQNFPLATQGRKCKEQIRDVLGVQCGRVALD